MTTTQPEGNPPAEGKQGKWWCNFCGLHTDDEKYYLAHSCQKELKKRGVDVPKEKGDHCR